jgi:hypothetical protein
MDCPCRSAGVSTNEGKEIKIETVSILKLSKLTPVEEKDGGTSGYRNID